VTGSDDSPATTPICDVIWFELYVDDIDRAIDFYRRAFGWVPRPFLEHDPTGGYVNVSYAQDAPTQGALVRRTGPSTDRPGVRTCVIYVQVPNLEAAIVKAAREALSVARVALDQAAQGPAGTLPDPRPLPQHRTMLGRTACGVGALRHAATIREGRMRSRTPRPHAVTDAEGRAAPPPPKQLLPAWRMNWGGPRGRPFPFSAFFGLGG
jgi:predicted enzyme related to lactoylglutathione lyase